MLWSMIVNKIYKWKEIWRKQKYDRNQDIINIKYKFTIQICNIYNIVERVSKKKNGMYKILTKVQMFTV